MNIKDIETPEVIPKKIWPVLFKKQYELVEKYKVIENMGDLLETRANNINTAKGQKWIKDFAWRVTEELAEAYEAKNEMKEAINLNLTELINDFEEHFKEELIDALHFLIELSIIAGVGADFVEIIDRKEDEQIDTHFYSGITYHLGLMCNTLKNKPWKQTEMLTDAEKFIKYLTLVWVAMLNALKFDIGSDSEVFKYYFKKNEVNKFRQKSKY